LDVEQGQSSARGASVRAPFDPAAPRCDNFFTASPLAVVGHFLALLTIRIVRARFLIAERTC
jgi:hypothetical protein